MKTYNDTRWAIGSRIALALFIVLIAAVVILRPSYGWTGELAQTYEYTVTCNKDFGGDPYTVECQLFEKDVWA